jgi:hypothetical protein
MMSDIQIIESDWGMKQIHFLWSGSEQRPQNFTDFVFRCKDGVIPAHGAYLSALCPVLSKVFAGFEAGNMTLVVPDVEVGIVAKFLELCYTGSTKLENASQFKKIKEFGFEQLGFSMTLNNNVTIDFPSPKKGNQSLLEMRNIKTRGIEQGTIEMGESAMQAMFTDDNSVLSNVPQLISKVEIGIEQMIDDDDSRVATFKKERNNHNQEKRKLKIKLKKNIVQAKQKMKTSKQTKMSSYPRNRKQKIEPSEIKCNICLENTGTLEKLRLHYREIHSITKPFKCTSCHLSYARRSMMLSHHRLVIFYIINAA